ncbi:MAG: alpha/beta-hydrolase N-terminal domain-containing protein, partial [Actinomyces sp.]|nr:alpha/beta-hydrolase N-terminal domain-containing protein [Actinomyces sp.]
MLDSPSLLGIIAALVMYAVSVSPSLLPRSWWWQAVVSGVLASLGYVVGVVIESTGTLILRLTDLTISASPATETGLRWAAFL